MISEIFKKIYKIKEIIRKKSLKGLLEKIKEKILLKKCYLSINQQYQIWLKKNYPTQKDLEKQKQEIKKFKIKPLISLITPVYNPEKQHLIECIESVLNQSYDNWELYLVDDASTKTYVKEILEEYSKKDKRIKIKFREKNGHICQASNDALHMAKGEYIGLLDHDDFLWPNALYEVVKLINEKPHSQFIYTDEDKLDYDGKTHIDPFFKPDWSPDYLRSINYITHFAVLKKSLIDKIGGFRVGTEGAQDWDLFLRATYWLEKNIDHCHPLDKKNPIQHVSTILYSWRKTSQSTASEKHAATVKDYAYKNQKKVLEDYLFLRNIKDKIEVISTQYAGLYLYKLKANFFKKIKKEIYISLKSKNKILKLNKEYIIANLLINKNSIIVPLLKYKNLIYDIKNNFLFFDYAPQPFPNLLKKDSNFNYQIDDETINLILNKKIPFICFKNKLTLTKDKIKKMFVISSPCFIIKK